jgi:hypothetical protein
MTLERALAIKQGDVVDYKGRQLTVASIRLRGSGAPYFRLNGLDENELKPGGDGLISYQLCLWVPDEA